MPSADALKRIAHLRTGSTGVPEILPKFPSFPEEIRKRFPTAIKEHEAALEDWRLKANIAIRGGTS